MQKLELLFLLAITSSMILAFGTPVLAQETPEDASGDEMIDEETTTDEETMGEEATDEETTDEELADETMMDDTMDDTMEEVMETITSPLMQMTAGVDPHEIQCNAGQKLVFKASNWRPSCINESSYDILAARGWVSSHDPTHEDLAAMMDEYMMAHPQEETETPEEVPEETPGEVEIEEGVVVEEEATAGNGTETEGETQPQSYSIDLSEDMEMGAQ